MFAWGRRCGGGRGIVESISEITHWRVLPSLTARGSAVHPKHIQYTDHSGHTVKEWKRGQTTAAVCSMSEQHNPHGKLHHHMFLCRFTASKWQFVNLTEKNSSRGFYTEKVCNSFFIIIIIIIWSSAHGGNHNSAQTEGTVLYSTWI